MSSNTNGHKHIVAPPILGHSSSPDASHEGPQPSTAPSARLATMMACILP